MHARYVTSVLAGLAGGILVVFSQALATDATAWVAFGLGIVLMVLAAIPTLFRDRHIVGIGLDGLTAGLGAWTIVASLVFAGSTVEWLTFAEGVGFVLLSVLGLTLNQVLLARRVYHAVPLPATGSAPIASRVSTGADEVRSPVAA
jgi:hypothetical protein